MNELDKLDLPAQIHERDKIILDYCNLRLKSYELTGKAISENTRDYDAQISEYVDSIKTDLEKLKQ